MNKFLSAALSTFFLSFVADGADALTTNFKVDAVSASRTAVIHIPDRIIEQHIQAPVVFALHGPGSTANSMQRSGHMIEEAEKRGYIVVIPDGSERGEYSGRFWNAEPFLAETEDYNLMSDEDFFVMLIRHLEREGVIDHGRVFAAGFSMGGMMAYKVACQMPERFSAVAVVAGALMSKDCDPTMPVSVFQIHSMGDERIPFFGGETAAAPGIVWPSVMSTIRDWKKSLTCGEDTTYQIGSEAQCAVSICGGGQVVKFCAAYSGGHDWPGKEMPKAYWKVNGEDTRTFRATPLIFDFFDTVPGHEAVAGP